MITQRHVRFAGYASLFDIPDADRDVVRKGAFTATLTDRKSPLPLLWQHRPDKPIGVIESVSEDKRGLRIVGRVDRTASRAAHLLKTKQISGLSFGYRARDARSSQAGRELLGIDLFEVSLVTQPLQYGARVHFVD